MKKLVIFVIVLVATFINLSGASVSYAQPYGIGNYDVNIPYGSQTSLSIATDGNVSIPITPTTTGASASGTSHVTVTSTDVTGYKLYIRALTSTSMNNLGALLPASGNVTPAALVVDTWGYNTDASSNFAGITLSDVLIRSTLGPVPSGEVTTVTYGIDLDLAKPAGNYTDSVVYTAVPQTD